MNTQLSVIIASGSFQGARSERRTVYGYLISEIVNVRVGREEKLGNDMRPAPQQQQQTTQVSCTMPLGPPPVKVTSVSICAQL
jgi:hypothetical protein